MFSEIIAFDPGGTTGVCHINNFRINETGQLDFDIQRTHAITWENRFKEVYDILKWFSNSTELAIVIEAFRLYARESKSQINSDFPSSQVIGIIQAYSHLFGILQYTEIVPAQVRLRAKVLSQHKKLLASGPHAKDAYQHARAFLVTNKKFAVFGD